MFIYSLELEGHVVQAMILDDLSDARIQELTDYVPGLTLEYLE